MTPTVAALFVGRRGPYWGRPDVDAWDEARDARQYSGGLPVVAHPPCGRWCQLAGLVEARYGYKVGDDGGCFGSALASVRRCGGVLEHPALSIAWARYGLHAPVPGGWQQDITGEWTCQVSQVAYGHRARKRTWLLYVGTNPPKPMDWREPAHSAVVGGCRNRCGAPLAARAWGPEAARTPATFCEALLSLARGCGGAP